MLLCDIGNSALFIELNMCEFMTRLATKWNLGLHMVSAIKTVKELKHGYVIGIQNLRRNNGMKSGNKTGVDINWENGWSFK